MGRATRVGDSNRSIWSGRESNGWCSEDGGWENNQDRDRRGDSCRSGLNDGEGDGQNDGKNNFDNN